MTSHYGNWFGRFILVKVETKIEVSYHTSQNGYSQKTFFGILLHYQETSQFRNLVEQLELENCDVIFAWVMSKLPCRCQLDRFFSTFDHFHISSAHFATRLMHAYHPIKKRHKSAIRSAFWMYSLMLLKSVQTHEMLFILQHFWRKFERLVGLKIWNNAWIFIYNLRTSRNCLKRYVHTAHKHTHTHTQQYSTHITHVPGRRSELINFNYLIFRFST